MNRVCRYWPSWTEDGLTLGENENIVVPLNEWSKIGVVYDAGCGYIILNGRCGGSQA